MQNKIINDSFNRETTSSLKHKSTVRIRVVNQVQPGAKITKENVLSHFASSFDSTVAEGVQLFLKLSINDAKVVLFQSGLDVAKQRRVMEKIDAEYIARVIATFTDFDMVSNIIVGINPNKAFEIFDKLDSAYLSNITAYLFSSYREQLVSIVTNATIPIAIKIMKSLSFNLFEFIVGLNAKKVKVFAWQESQTPTEAELTILQKKKEITEAICKDVFLVQSLTQMPKHQAQQFLDNIKSLISQETYSRLLSLLPV